MLFALPYSDQPMRPSLPMTSGHIETSAQQVILLLVVQTYHMLENKIAGMIFVWLISLPM